MHMRYNVHRICQGKIWPFVTFERPWHAKSAGWGPREVQLRAPSVNLWRGARHPTDRFHNPSDMGLIRPLWTYCTLQTICTPALCGSFFFKLVVGGRTGFAGGSPNFCNDGRVPERNAIFLHGAKTRARINTSTNRNDTKQRTFLGTHTRRAVVLKLHERALKQVCGANFWSTGLVVCGFHHKVRVQDRFRTQSDTARECTKHEGTRISRSTEQRHRDPRLPAQGCLRFSLQPALQVEPP